MQADCFNVQLVAVGPPADCVQQRLAFYGLSAFQLGEYAVAIFVETDGHHFFPEAKNRSQLAKLEAQALDDLAIGKV